jgi:hypothetical protein
MSSGTAARAGSSDDGKPIPLSTTMSPPISTDGAGETGKPEELGEPKARKACSQYLPYLNPTTCLAWLVLFHMRSLSLWDLTS